jgi:hypothetical protein
MANLLALIYQNDIIMISEGENVHVAGERAQTAPRLAHGGDAQPIVNAGTLYQ